MWRFYEEKKPDTNRFNISLFKGEREPVDSSFSKPLREMDLLNNPDKEIGTLSEKIEKMFVL